MAIPIRGFLESTLIDWEGKIASEVFLGGCNLRCPYCHSAYLVHSPPDAETISLQHVINYIQSSEGWIDGVIFTGGEPTPHKGLADAMQTIKELGLQAKLDTNGTLPDRLALLFDKGVVDYVAMDVKASLEKYAIVTNADVDPTAIRKSIDLIEARAPDYEFRTTVCPAFVKEEDIEAIATMIEGAKKYVLQQFRPQDCLDPDMNLVRPYKKDRLEKMVASAATKVRNCVLRNA